MLSFSVSPKIKETRQRPPHTVAMAHKMKVNTKASSSKEKRWPVHFRVADCVETIESINVFIGHQKNTEEKLLLNYKIISQGNIMGIISISVAHFSRQLPL